MNDIKYSHTLEIHNTNAARAFIPVLERFIEPQSIIDVGCGLGTWLKVFQEKGIKDVLGVDGANVDKTMLAIPEENFIEHDLRLPFQLHRKFDLAICLEVAEHLPADCADNVIDILSIHSDNILFSAALPNQGGQNHINERRFTYWIEKFNKRGFEVLDAFREIIWDNCEIDWWYRQNVFLVAKADIVKQKRLHDYYHPEAHLSLYNEKEDSLRELKLSLEENRKIKSGEIAILKAVVILLKSIVNFLK